MSNTEGLAELRFGPFRIDVANEMLLCGEEERHLTPKAFAVLRYLIAHEATLVTKRALLDAIWPDAIVGDAVLKVTVSEIRKNLDDDSREPTFVQTVHRRGYRFIHPVERIVLEVQSRPRPQRSTETASVWPVGRESVIRDLEHDLEELAQGEGKTIFVTGPAGRGKTTVARSLLSAAQTQPALNFVLHGACFETLGESEPLLPLIDAISEFVREEKLPEAVLLLRRYAPALLLRIPGLLDLQERDEIGASVLGASTATLRREIAEFVSALTRRAPVILVLEDMHWSDAATLDLLRQLADRRVPGLLILATWRPEDAEHDLRRFSSEMVASRAARQVPLSALDKTGVEAYLQRRFKVTIDARVLRLILTKTEGHPLFFVNLVDDLEQTGAIRVKSDRLVVESPDAILHAIPNDLEQMILARLSRLTPDARRILEAAAVASIGRALFSAQSVEAALENPPDDVDDQIHKLANQGRLVCVESPIRFDDGAIISSYSFAHTLYQEVLYRGLSESRRRRYHLRIVKRGEVLLSGRTDDFAHEMADHYERAGNARLARQRWLQAARVGEMAHRFHDVQRYLTRALAQPNDESNNIDLLESRGLVRRAIGDAIGAEEDFLAMAREAETHDLLGRSIEAQLYLGSVRFWIDTEQALESVRRANELSRDLDDPEMRAHVAGYLGHLQLNLRGFDAAATQACSEAVATSRSSGEERHLAFHLSRMVWMEATRSNYQAALVAADESISLNLAQGNAFDYLLVLFLRSWAELHLGDWKAALEHLGAGHAMAERNAHRAWACLFGVVRGHLLVEIGLADEAQDLCTSALEAIPQDAPGSGQLRFHAMIIRGMAEVSGGQQEDGLRELERVNEAVRDKPHALDQMLYFPLNSALAEARLQAGDLLGAKKQATRLQEHASNWGERSYLTTASSLLSRVAAAEGHHDKAKQELDKALAALADGAVPLPVAARLGRQHVLEGNAAERTERAAAELSQSLQHWPELREAWRVKSASRE